MRARRRKKPRQDKCFKGRVAGGGADGGREEVEGWGGS